MWRLWGDIVQYIEALLSGIVALCALWTIVVASIQKYRTHQWLTRRTLQYALLGSIAIIAVVLVTYPIYRNNLREFALHLLNEKPIRIDTGQQWKGKVFYEERSTFVPEKEKEPRMVPFDVIIEITGRTGDLFFGELQLIHFRAPPSPRRLPPSSSYIIGIPSESSKHKVKGGIAKDHIFFVEYADSQESIISPTYYEGRIDGKSMTPYFPVNNEHVRRTSGKSSGRVRVRNAARSEGNSPDASSTLSYQ